jgi:hypothetical protein
MSRAHARIRHLCCKTGSRSAGSSHTFAAAFLGLRGEPGFTSCEFCSLETMNQFVLLAAAAALLVTSTSAYSAEPAVICESGKLKTAGKYSSCMLSAESKAVKTNTSVDNSKCISTFGTKWQKSEESGADNCPCAGGTKRHSRSASASHGVGARVRTCCLRSRCIASLATPCDSGA